MPGRAGAMPSAPARSIVFLMAAWFGVLTGLVEGAEFLGLQAAGWLGRGRMM